MQQRTRKIAGPDRYLRRHESPRIGSPRRSFRRHRLPWEKVCCPRVVVHHRQPQRQEIRGAEIGRRSPFEIVVSFSEAWLQRLLSAGAVAVRVGLDRAPRTNGVCVLVWPRFFFLPAC